MNTADAIRTKVQDLARQLGRQPRPIRDDEIIPETGLLDSASILELVMWLETEYDIEIDQADFNLENLGSVERIVRYLEAHQA
ncbi:MAG TPA: phosphopantetheine-binding protein [Vicinamibacterales bacterium]